MEMQKPNAKETVNRPDILANEKLEVVQFSKKPDSITKAQNCTIMQTPSGPVNNSEIMRGSYTQVPPLGDDDMKKLQSTGKPLNVQPAFWPVWPDCWVSFTSCHYNSVTMSNNNNYGKGCIG